MIKKKEGLGASNPLSPITYKSSNFIYMPTAGKNILYNKHFIKNTALAIPT